MTDGAGHAPALAPFLLLRERLVELLGSAPSCIATRPIHIGRWDRMWGFKVYDEKSKRPLDQAESIARDPEASKLLLRDYRKHWSVPKGV